MSITYWVIVIVVYRHFWKCWKNKVLQSNETFVFRLIVDSIMLKAGLKLWRQAPDRMNLFLFWIKDYFWLSFCYISSPNAKSVRRFNFPSSPVLSHFGENYFTWISFFFENVFLIRQRIKFWLTNFRLFCK